MKTFYFPKTLLLFFVLCIPFLTIVNPMVHGETGKTLEDLYPGLASDVLKAATPATRSQAFAALR